MFFYSWKITVFMVIYFSSIILTFNSTSYYTLPFNKINENLFNFKRKCFSQRIFEYKKILMSKNFKIKLILYIV